MQRTRTLLLIAAATLVGLVMLYFAVRSESTAARDRTEPRVAATETAAAPPATIANAAPVAAPLPFDPAAQHPAAPVAELDDATESAPPASSGVPEMPFDEAMKSDDPAAMREAIEGAVLRGDVAALKTIQKVDLTRDGYVAAAAIDAVGKLGALAPEPEKREAVRTLDGWLKQESKRKEPDALGNVSIAVDALRDTKSQDAAAPLIAALDSASQPLHIETRIVEALDVLGARTAAPAVGRFVTRVQALKPADEFEQALAAEALAAAEAALKSWGVQ